VGGIRECSFGSIPSEKDG
jgi:hypothetical protein